MERAQSLSQISDLFSQRIVHRIKDPKEQLLVILLYKVCQASDYTHQTFLRSCIRLFQKNILSDLSFLRLSSSNGSSPPSQVHRNSLGLRDIHENEHLSLSSGYEESTTATSSSSEDSQRSSTHRGEGEERSRARSQGANKKKKNSNRKTERKLSFASEGSEASDDDDDNEVVGLEGLFDQPETMMEAMASLAGHLGPGEKLLPQVVPSFPPFRVHSKPPSLFSFLSYRRKRTTKR